MQFNVTAEEIEQSAELLEMLKKWEALKAIAGQYNNGAVQLSMSGNGGNHRIDYSVDSYHLEHSSAKTPVKKCSRDIGLVLGAHATQAAEEVCKIIRRHMPIPVAE